MADDTPDDLPEDANPPPETGLPNAGGNGVSPEDAAAGKTLDDKDTLDAPGPQHAADSPLDAVSEKPALHGEEDKNKSLAKEGADGGPTGDTEHADDGQNENNNRKARAFPDGHPPKDHPDEADAVAPEERTSTSFPVPDVSGKGWPPGGTGTGTGTPRPTDQATPPGEVPNNTSGAIVQPGGTIAPKPKVQLGDVPSDGSADLVDPKSDA